MITDVLIIHLMHIEQKLRKTWERIVDENDVQSYTLSIVEDLVEPNLCF